MVGLISDNKKQLPEWRRQTNTLVSGQQPPAVTPWYMLSLYFNSYLACILFHITDQTKPAQTLASLNLDKWLTSANATQQDPFCLAVILYCPFDVWSVLSAVIWLSFNFSWSGFLPWVEFAVLFSVIAGLQSYAFKVLNTVSKPVVWNNELVYM